MRGDERKRRGGHHHIACQRIFERVECGAGLSGGSTQLGSHLLRARQVDVDTCRDGVRQSGHICAVSGAPSSLYLSTIIGGVSRECSSAVGVCAQAAT